MERTIWSNTDDARNFSWQVPMALGVACLILAIASGTLYYQLRQTQQTLVTKETELGNANAKITGLSDQINNLTTDLEDAITKIGSLGDQINGLEAENDDLTGNVEDLTDDLANQEAIAECMTGIVGSFAVASSEAEFYYLISPYEEVCSKAAELL
jgi:septal ring factor EnvC (AmiA/AmiB activator)